MSRRSPAWLPYLQFAEIVKKKKIRFVYNGGEITCSPKELSSVMIYGTEVDIPLNVIELLASQGVPIILHRRHVAATVWICSGIRAQEEDVLDRQMLYRRNEVKRRYITRRLLEEKFKAMRWLTPVADGLLNQHMTVDEMRVVEAHIARRYWDAYMKGLGVEGGRRTDNQIVHVLNSTSKFMAGIVLRWVCYHHFSPYHGFCHEPTDYPALVYDLIEPYRPKWEEALFEFFQLNPGLDDDHLMNAAMGFLKEYLDGTKFVGAARKIVTRHELFHGIVLSLRRYVLGQARKFTVPREDVPNGGRPPKELLPMYGRKAGITNTWAEAKAL